MRLPKPSVVLPLLPPVARPHTADRQRAARESKFFGATWRVPLDPGQIRLRQFLPVPTRLQPPEASGALRAAQHPNAAHGCMPRAFRPVADRTAIGTRGLPRATSRKVDP